MLASKSIVFCMLNIQKKLKYIDRFFEEMPRAPTSQTDESVRYFVVNDIYSSLFDEAI